MREVFTQMDPNKIQSEDLRDTYREIANLLGVSVEGALTEVGIFFRQEIKWETKAELSVFMIYEIEGGIITVKRLDYLFVIHCCSSFL